MNTARIGVALFVLLAAYAHVACSSSGGDPEPVAPADDAGAAASDAAAPSTPPGLSSFGDAGTVAHADCGGGAAGPTPGTACKGIGQCEVPMGPCGSATFECKTSVWVALAPAPTCAACPATAPVKGSACNLAIDCRYDALSKAAGAATCAWDLATCSSLDGTWHSDHEECIAPCPVDPPAEGTLCDGPLVCYWAGACHAQTYGRCKDNAWSIIDNCK